MSRLVYVGAALAEWHTARGLAEGIRAMASFGVGSRWHDLVGPGVEEPSGNAARADILAGNIADMERSHLMMAYCATGRPRATLGEIAWMLASGKTVIWIQSISPDSRCLFDAHTNARRVDSTREALLLLQRLA